MQNRSNQPDDPIDRALDALRSAQSPEGMEARIRHTLDARLAEPQPASFLRSSWLRGALTGALAATAACGVLFFTLRPHPTAAPAAMAHAIQLQQSPTAAPVSLNAATPCAGPKNIEVRHAGSAGVGNVATDSGMPHASRNSLRNEWDEASAPPVSNHAPHLIPASFAPSKPAPPAPPTAQERTLMHLVRTATPAQLAALNRPADARSDVEREAAFQKFFAPSPEIQAIDEAQRKALGIPDNESATPSSSKDGQL
jgi:hypothetical protein